MDRILMAANAEAEQPWVADAAAQLAKETGAEVTVLSVDELETEMLSTVPRADFVRQADTAADRAIARLRDAGVETVTKELRSGRALDQILAYAASYQPDVIVTGSSTRGRLATALLGSVPMALVQRAGRPVLVVTEPGAAA